MGGGDASAAGEEASESTGAEVWRRMARIQRSFELITSALEAEWVWVNGKLGDRGREEVRAYVPLASNSMCLIVELLPVFSDQRNWKREVERQEEMEEIIKRTYSFCLDVPDLDVALGGADVDEVSARVKPADAGNFPEKRQQSASKVKQMQRNPTCLVFFVPSSSSSSSLASTSSSFASRTHRPPPSRKSTKTGCSCP